MQPATVTHSDQLGPYGETAADYWSAGWRGVLPLPPHAKGNPPAGYTGAGGVFPSYPDVQAWCDGSEAAGNIALRLPQHVLGIDVDAYEDKPGAKTIADAAGRWGPLPATWRSSSRFTAGDPVSGIRLFRVPEGLAWPGEVGPGVELIQHRHRYLVAPPSIHPEGREYTWETPGGEESLRVPHVDELPALPQTWVEGLTGGRAHADVARNSLPTSAAGAWLLERDVNPSTPCPRMGHVAGVALAELAAPGSSHEAARGSVMRLCRLAAEGHPGIVAALGQLGAAFVADVTTPGRHGHRSPGMAAHEWQTLVTGAVNLLTAEPDTPQQPVEVDPCDNPFAGIVSPHHVAPATAPLTLPPAPPHTTFHTPAPWQDDRPGGPGRTAGADDPGIPDTVDDDVELDVRSLVAGGGAPGIPAASMQAPVGPPERERTSWWAADLAAVLSGRDDDPTAKPAYLARLDGKLLLYPGRTNGLLGESESGKTWVALEAIRQTLTGGEVALMLDFEDTAGGTVARLRAMGLDADALAGFVYVAPDEVLHPVAGQDFAELLATHRPGLIVLDGVNAAMTLLGLELESNTDSTKFAQTLLRPLAATGAAVLTIDHLPKSRENRGKGGIGAQAKRAMMTGAAITVDVITPAAPGRTGKLSLSVDKDRPGAVRAVSLASRSVGTCLIASDPATGHVSVSIEAPAIPTNTAGAFRPTVLMERVSKALAATPGEWVSRAGVQRATGGNSKAVIDATDRLVEEGFVERRPGRAGALEHKHVAAFLADVVDLEHLVAAPAEQLTAVRKWWDQEPTDLDDEGDDEP